MRGNPQRMRSRPGFPPLATGIWRRNRFPSAPTFCYLSFAIQFLTTLSGSKSVAIVSYRFQPIFIGNHLKPQDLLCAAVSAKNFSAEFDYHFSFLRLTLTDLDPLSQGTIWNWNMFSFSSPIPLRNHRLRIPREQNEPNTLNCFTLARKIGSWNCNHFLFSSAISANCLKRSSGVSLLIVAKWTLMDLD